MIAKRHRLLLSLLFLCFSLLFIRQHVLFTTIICSASCSRRNFIMLQAKCAAVPKQA